MNVSEPAGLPEEGLSVLDPSAPLQPTAAGAAALAQARRLYRDEAPQEHSIASHPQAPFQRRPD
jgi:hypothetical protein